MANDAQGNDLWHILGSLTVGQIFGGIAAFWNNHKLLGTIVYAGIAGLLGILGYGGVTYYKYQSDASQFQQIYPEYVQLRKENLQLRKENDQLQAKDVYYETILALASKSEERLLSISYAISSVMFGSTDIHDPQILRQDELAWEVLNEFADFILDFRKLLEKLYFASKPGESQARKVREEAAHYAVLKGKYYQALARRDDVRGALARDSFLRELKGYEDAFPEYKYYSEYVRGLYNRDILVPPVLKVSEEHFNNAIRATPAGKFWPAPHYAKIGVYESMGDRRTFLKQAEHVKKLFEDAKATHHQLYMATLVALVESYFAEQGPSSKNGTQALNGFKKIWAEVKGNIAFERFRMWASDIELFELGIEILRQLDGRKFSEVSVRLASLDNQLGQTEYFRGFLTMLSHYAHAELLVQERKIDEAERRLDKALTVPEESKVGSPAFLIKWIKALASEKKKALRTGVVKS